MESPRRREILICGAQYDSELRSGKMSALELAPLAAKLGADGVEYREVYWKDKATELPRVLEQLSELGLKATYATFTTLFNRDPAKQELLLRDLDDAHALGSPLMRVFRGEWPGKGPDDEHMVDAAGHAIERAGRYGMRLALENFIGPGGTRMEEIKATVERLDSPVLGVNIDTSNYVVNEQDPLKAIALLSRWVIYCHLKDVKHTPEGPKATVIGDGYLPFKEILAALSN